MAKERLPRIVAPLGGGTGITSDHRLVTGVTGRGRAVSLNDGQVAMPARRSAPVISLANPSPAAAPFWTTRPPSYQTGLMFVPFEITCSGALTKAFTSISTQSVCIEQYFLHQYETVIEPRLRFDCYVMNRRPDGTGAYWMDEQAFFATANDAVAFANANRVTPPTWLESVPYAMTLTENTFGGFVQYSDIAIQGVATIRQQLYPFNANQSWGWDSYDEGQWYIALVKTDMDVAGVTVTATTQWIIDEQTSTFADFPVKLTYHYLLTTDASICDTFSLTASWYFPVVFNLIGHETDHYTASAASFFQISGANERQVTATITTQSPSLLYMACLTAPQDGRNVWVSDVR